MISSDAMKQNLSKLILSKTILQLLEVLNGLSLKTVGIFRISPQAPKLNQAFDDLLRLKIDVADLAPETDQEFFYAALLKAFLMAKNQEDPIFSQEEFKALRFVYSKYPHDYAQRRDIYQEVILGMDYTRSSVLFGLLAMLQKVDALSDSNKMNADNLAMVFLPSLVSVQESQQQSLENHRQDKKIIFDLISHGDTLKKASPHPNDMASYLLELKKAIAGFENQEKRQFIMLIQKDLLKEVERLKVGKFGGTKVKGIDGYLPTHAAKIYIKCQQLTEHNIDEVFENILKYLKSGTKEQSHSQRIFSERQPETLAFYSKHLNHALLLKESLESRLLPDAEHVVEL